MSQPFQIATPANTVVIDIAATTASVALPANPYQGSRTLRIFNDDQATCWIELGVTGLEAEVANCHPIASKTHQDFEIGQNVTHVACIGQGTPNGDLYITTGYVL